MMTLLDDVRARLAGSTARRKDSFAFAVSGTGTQAMETSSPTWSKDGTRATGSSPAISAIASRRCASATARR